MHGKSQHAIQYTARVPFLESDQSVRLERIWRFERDVARARMQSGISPERALDWLVMLSLARDWAQGMEPDVAATTAAVELPRTTVKRSLDGLVDRDAIRLERCRRDGRRRIVKPGPTFDQIFVPLLERVGKLVEENYDSIGETVRVAISAMTHAVLMTNAPDPGAPPQIVAANAAFTSLTGYEESEALGKSPSMLQGDGTADAPRQAIRTAIDSRTGTTVELVNYRKNGTAYMCHLTLEPILGKDGNAQYFIGIARNIGELSA